MQIRVINTTAKTETMLSGFNPRTVREAREIAIALRLSMIADPCYDREDHCWNIYFVERAA